MGRNIQAIIALKDQFSPNMKKIAEATGKSEKEIKKARMEVVKFQKDAKKAAINIGKNLLIGVGAMGAGMYTLALKTSNAGDRVDKMSQKLGMSRKTFQEMDYVFSQAGIEMDSFGVGAKKLAQAVYDSGKKGSESGAIFKKLGVSVKNSNGVFKSQEEIFKNTLIGLQKMPQGINKAIYAQKLFGKQGQALMPLLNDESKNIDELVRQCNNLGMVMSDKAVDASVKFNDTIDTLGRSFSAIGYSLGADILPMFQKVADTLIINMPKIKAATAPVFTGLSSALGFVIENINWLIPLVGGLTGAFLTVNMAVTVVETIKRINSAVNAAKVAQIGWNASLIANPIGISIVGLGLLLASIWKIIDAYKVLQSMRPDLKTNSLKELTPQEAKKYREYQALKRPTEIRSMPKYALGTTYATGGASLVGENGPEIVDLKRGSNVTNTQQSSRLMGNTINIKLEVKGNMIGNSEYANYISNLIASKLQDRLAIA